MNAIADRYAAHNIGSIFLYTHEAHPGENYPHLTSMEQKFRHAYDLRDVLGVTRPILVDALDGACHENAIQYFAQIPQRRKAGERLAPFHVERLDYRNQEREQFYRALERNGPKAVEEFRKAFPTG
ncbi:MAG: hypothetical protein HZB18_05270 [Chloroflexi bacterium]|nr:hypothetical protein [Chloroflexota bacterium]